MPHDWVHCPICQGAEERLDLNAAVLNAADGLGVFARAGAGAFDGKLAGDDFLPDSAALLRIFERFREQVG